MATPMQPEQFFNLHTSGIGYISRVRWVDSSKKNGGRRAEPFLSCAINALRGSSDEVQYTYFDVKVCGEEAIQVVADLEAAANSESKVLVAFKVADIYIHTYQRRQRDQNGRQTDQMEWANLLKGRLIRITMAKVDGELVYERAVVPEGSDSAQVGLEGGTHAAPPKPEDATPQDRSAPRARPAQPTAARAQSQPHRSHDRGEGRAPRRVSN